MAIGRRRAAAAFAAVCVLIGAVLVTVVGSSLPMTTYLSEAGVGPSSVPYRLGILVLAAGLLSLAVSLRVGLAAVLLAAGAGFTAVSGVVPCTAGCPLPPYEPTTARDLVHGGASIAAVAACVFAMVAVGLSVAPLPRSPWLGRLLAAAGAPSTADAPPAGPAPDPRDVRNRGPSGARVAPRYRTLRGGSWSVRSEETVARVSLGAAAVALPLSGLVGLAMIATGRGALIGVTERILLVVTATWAGYLAVSRVFAAGPGVDVEAPSRS